MQPFVWPVRIYYEDTDFSGFVYHARYLHFMERARSEWLRALGVDQVALWAAQQGGFVVHRLVVDYIKPAAMDDLLQVETFVQRVSGALVVLRQRVVRQGIVLVEAEVAIAYVEAGRARRLPLALRQALS